MNTKQNSVNSNKGFTLVEIMIVVAIIGLLAAIAIPNFVKAREASQKSACISNLKQIEGAIAVYAMENGKATADTVILDATDTTAGLFGDKGYIKTTPVCAAGGTYAITTVGTRPTCTVAGHNL